MARKSERLVALGYYDDKGCPIISYKERLFRAFKSRRRRKFPPEALEEMIQSQFEEAYVHGNMNSQTSGKFVEKRSTFWSVWPVGFLILTALQFMTLNQSICALNPALTALYEEVQELKRKVDYLLPEAEVLPNVALTSLGARIVDSRTSPPYLKIKSSFLCGWLGICKPIPPTVVIKGSTDLVPGNCWAFAGQRGQITISLPGIFPIAHVTLGHVAKSVSPTGAIAGAPKEFSVYGQQTTDDIGMLIGVFLYDINGGRFQTFKIADHRTELFRFVRVQVHSNWGEPEYTCIYSFRVHTNRIMDREAENPPGGSNSAETKSTGFQQNRDEEGRISEFPRDRRERIRIQDQHLNMHNTVPPEIQQKDKKQKKNNLKQGKREREAKKVNKTKDGR